MSLSLDINSQQLNALIARTMRTRNTKKLMQRTGRIAHTDTLMNFKRSVSPDGVPWARLKHRNGKPLIDTGRLRNSITLSASDDQAVVGTNVKYAPTHQFGATIKPKKGRYLTFKIGKQWVKKSQVVIPARPFIGFSQRLIGKINKEASDWLEDTLND